MPRSQTIVELAASVCDVDFEAWQRAGITIVGLDVDGTITTHNGTYIEPKIIRHIRAAAQKGMRFVLLTNNMFTKRLLSMQAEFGGSDIVEAIYKPRYFFDRKPRRILLRRMIQDLNLEPHHIGVVGNTYSADVRSAVRMGVARVAWVDGYASRGLFDLFIRRPLKNYHRRKVSR